jgi:glc operon protein GlcG
MKTTHSIDCSEAQEIVRLIVNQAGEMQKAVAVAVVDPHGELVAFARMDEVPLPSISIAINKAWTAARAQKPTKEIGDKVRHPEKGFDIAYYGDPRFVGWGGGIPLVRDGQVIGAVGVSGLSSVEDVSLATLGANLMGARQ